MFTLGEYDGIEIATGVNPSLSGGKFEVNHFLVDGLLIDCGPMLMAEDIRRFVKTHRVEQVAITHVHEDHCGNAAWIAENLGVPIYVPPEAVEEARRDAVMPPSRFAVWGERPAFPAIAMPDIIKTEKFSFRTIDAPGHVPYLRVLLEPSTGWLFTGDLYVRTRYRFMERGEESASVLIASLEKVLKLDFGTVFCSHAGVMEDGRERLKAKLDYLLDLRGEVYARRERGQSDEQITRELFPDNEAIEEITDGSWSARILVETI
jgi:glyoxylase-like metal-dependent hydrolase (beta-lactamase superfamily II)